MTLTEYLDTHAVTFAAFAERIGASHARTVERYAKGQRIPDATMMPRIVEATDGAVTPNDFFGVTSATIADRDAAASGKADEVSSPMERVA